MIPHRLTSLQRQLPAALALAGLLLVVALVAPSFFSGANLRDVALGTAPTLLVAIGMTLVVLVGEIDISVGAQFAVCSVVVGLMAKAGIPMLLLLLVAMLLGGAMGALNGLLVGRLGLPSIIVTLAMLVIWRDGLRWTTQGAWVQDLPAGFQWFGLAPGVAQGLIIGTALAVLAAAGWALRYLVGGRTFYAVGSNREAARLAGIEPWRVVAGAYVALGALVGLAALLNSVRFASIPGNPGAGLEMKTIAAVVVGGAAITGGRGRMLGTLLGVVLLGTIGTALTYLGISPFWERAIQGAIILAALGSEALLTRFGRRRALFAAPVR